MCKVGGVLLQRIVFEPLNDCACYYEGVRKRLDCVVNNILHTNVL